METKNPTTLKCKIIASKKLDDFFNHLINDHQENSHKVIETILDELLLEENSKSNLDYIVPENSIFHKLYKSSDSNEKQTNLKNFIITFFSKLTGQNQIVNKILSNAQVLKEISEIISNFTNLKNKELLILSSDLKSSALEIFFTQSLNFKFWKSFIEVFELTDLIFTPDSNSGTIYIIEHIKNLMEKSISEKNTKLEQLIKLIELTNEVSAKENFTLLDQINSNLLLDYLLSDKSLFSFVKKLLKVFPHNSEYVINYYLSINDTKSASSLYKESEHIDPKIKEAIIFKSQCKSIKYHYFRYKNYEIEFQQLIELADKNILIISYLIELLCKDNLIIESYHLLRIYDFNLYAFKVEENSLRKIQEFLNSLNNEAYAGSGGNSSKSNNFSGGSSNLYRRVDTKFLKTFANHKNLQISCEDYFGPYEYSCYKLPLRKEDIIFVDSVEKLKKIGKFVAKKSNQKSKSNAVSNSNLDDPYVGFDAEWKSPSCIFEHDNGASIIQLAIKDKVFIFDCIKLNTLPEEELKNFGKIFLEIFKEKTIIGFSYKHDFDSIKNAVIKKSLMELKSIDFIEVYEKKFSTKCPNLKKVCNEVLNKDLCKFEQVSNWEIRPLRLRQLHYAALDAYVLLKLFENM